MPGVDSVYMIYSNDFTAGSSLDITVEMPTASEEQIAEVAQRINELKRDDFDGYPQETEFVVGERITVGFGAVLKPDQVADRARRLRQIDSAAPKAEITWSGGGLELRDAPAAAESFAAVRTGLGAESAYVTVLPRDNSPVWDAEFPFSIQQEAHIRRQLSGLPVDVNSVTVKDGVLFYLSARIRGPKVAYQDLTAVIASVRPTAKQPMLLEWTWAETDDAERSFAGSVHVSGCRYSGTAGEKDPRRYYTAEAIELQRRLRDEFDACR